MRDSSHNPPALECVYHTTPDRVNEDAFVAMHTGPLAERLMIAAIDGATTRLSPPPLQAYLDTLPGSLTPAAFSARMVRDSIAQQVATEMPPELRTLLLNANAALRRALIEILGALTLEAMQFPPEIHDRLQEDPRLVRLGLPASVATLAEYDPAAHELRWVHCGDTLLLVAYQDGRVEVPTMSPIDDPDRTIKRMVLAMRESEPGKSLRELTQSKEVRRNNLLSGLRHNYVDEHGLPQPSQGIGVLNGMPELRYFLTTGIIDLRGVAFVCVMTDGLEWPASAEEVFAEAAGQIKTMRAERHAYMARAMARQGLCGYLQLLREAEADDADHDQFPRMKTHDDATGILLRFAVFAG